MLKIVKAPEQWQTKWAQDVLDVLTVGVELVKKKKR